MSKNPDYNFDGSDLSTIKIIEDLNLGFHDGNAIYHIAKAAHEEDKSEDLRKAAWHINRMIGDPEAPVIEVKGLARLCDLMDTHFPKTPYRFDWSDSGCECSGGMVLEVFTDIERSAVREAKKSIRYALREEGFEKLVVILAILERPSGANNTED